MTLQLISAFVFAFAQSRFSHDLAHMYHMYCIPSDDDDTGSIMKQQFDVFATSLPTCVNRDLIDKVGLFGGRFGS